MISVDNSPKTRILSSVDIKLNENIKTKELFDKVIKKIEEIEKNSVEIRNYNLIDNILSEDIEYKNVKEQLSIFKYKTLIEKTIKTLIVKKIFIRELKELRNNIYLLLVSDIATLKYYISKIKRSHPKLIYTKHRKFKNYKDSFEKLYTSHLSNIGSEFKEPFFNLFKDINVCPYCNRNFINPINKKSFTKIKGANDNQFPDIEHFFPKSIFPFLSLSISNLMPSCAFCNKIKSNVDTYTNNCISPYEIKENDTRFKFEFDSTDINNRKIILKLADGIKNSDVLHLDSLYNKIHSNYVNDMFTKQKKYPDTNKKFLHNTFNLSEEDYEKEFCNYYNEKDFNKHPLSKMTKDLYEHIKEYGE